MLKHSLSIAQVFTYIINSPGSLLNQRGNTEEVANY